MKQHISVRELSSYVNHEYQQNEDMLSKDQQESLLPEEWMRYWVKINPVQKKQRKLQSDLTQTTQLEDHPRLREAQPRILSIQVESKQLNQLRRLLPRVHLEMPLGKMAPNPILPILASRFSPFFKGAREGVRYRF